VEKLQPLSASSPLLSLPPPNTPFSGVGGMVSEPPPTTPVLPATVNIFSPVSIQPAPNAQPGLPASKATTSILRKNAPNGLFLFKDEAVELGGEE